MKKLYKVLFILCLLLIPIFKINALESRAVDYKIEHFYIKSDMDMAGNLNVKEIIGVKGSFNGYKRDLEFNYNTKSNFTGTKKDFESNIIYSPTNIDGIKVGKIDCGNKPSISCFNNKPEFFTLSENLNNGDKSKYSISRNNGNISIKMYNETYRDITYFYIEYLVGNAVVIHNDVAELYYNYIGKGFADDINDLEILSLLPDSTEENIKIWAHGPLNGESKRIIDEKNEKLSLGAQLLVPKLNAYSPVDLRMTFPHDLIMVDHPFLKKTNTEALPKILEVEGSRADAANKSRTKSKVIVITTSLFGIIYALGLILSFTYIYLKHDKEYRSNFKNKYNREFINDYDVESIEYLFNKTITANAFSTSILNLIYKKVIKIEEISKKDYKLIKVPNTIYSENEGIIIDTLFEDIGNGKEVLLSDIKKYAKKTSTLGVNNFLNSYNKWVKHVTESSKELNFYEDNGKLKAGFLLYGIIGFIFIFILYNIGIKPFVLVIIGIILIAYMLYVALFTRRSIKGNEDYIRWKAFKRFLLDFGRFDEKELPEIKLWERYLVYASIFGIANKVQKTMKIKFEQINPNYSVTPGDIMFDYFMFSSFAPTINASVASSVSTAISSVQAASSSSSSGSGGGGGFSSGGGFGGGGGGGSGF